MWKASLNNVCSQYFPGFHNSTSVWAQTMVSRIDPQIMLLFTKIVLDLITHFFITEEFQCKFQRQDSSLWPLSKYFPVFVSVDFLSWIFVRGESVSSKKNVMTSISPDKRRSHIEILWNHQDHQGLQGHQVFRSSGHQGHKGCQGFSEVECDNVDKREDEEEAREAAEEHKIHWNTNTSNMKQLTPKTFWGGVKGRKCGSPLCFPLSSSVRLSWSAHQRVRLSLQFVIVDLKKWLYGWPPFNKLWFRKISW